MTTRVFVLLVPDLHLQDLAGPVQVFYEANAFGRAGAFRFFFESA